MKLIFNIVCIILAQAASLHQSSLSARTRLRSTLDVKFNLDCHLPQCNSTDPDKSAVNLFQVISSNPETPLKTNFIWSNIGGPPMVITTSSTQESNLKIDWHAILEPKQDVSNGSNNNNSEQTTTLPANQDQNASSTVKPTPQPSPPTPNTSGFHFDVTQDAAMGLLVEKIVLFDDADKSGLFTPDKPRIEIDWGQIVWDLASRTTYHKDDFLKTHMRMKANHKYLNGNLWIKLAIPRDYKADRQKEVPHLKLNSQSISIVIIVDGMQPPPEFKNARLAMTLVVVVQSAARQISLDTDSESLISDEYTPGVFRIKSLQFRSKQDQAINVPHVDEQNSSNLYAEIDGKPAKSVAPDAPLINREKLGFLYWKEVAYTDRRKIVSRTIDVFDSEMQMSMDTLPNISQPFYQYFKYQPSIGLKPEYKLYRFELIYGKGDSTYSSTNFTDFSFVFGLGDAPQEQIFSFLVKVIIFVCFCLPLLVMLAGLGYLMLRRFRRNGDTELLLAAES